MMKMIMREDCRIIMFELSGSVVGVASSSQDLSYLETWAYGQKHI